GCATAASVENRSPRSTDRWGQKRQARTDGPEPTGIGVTNMASLSIQPYLFFEGRCEEALDFYRRALGAEVLALMRSKDSPDPAMIIPGGEDKIMHAMFRVGETTILASDGRCQGTATFQGFSLSITTPGVAENQRLFAALGEGGQVLMPLMSTFF